MPGNRLDRKVVSFIKTVLVRVTAIALAALRGFGVAGYLEGPVRDRLSRHLAARGTGQ